MAKAPTLPTITGSFASSAQLNAAFRDIEDAFDNTLSLDGSVPNSMNADLDMNGFDILNINTLQVEDLSVAGQPLGLLAAVEEANEAAADANSSASLAAASAASINLPPITGKALNTLRVNATATGYEHRTPTQALADLGVTATAVELNIIDGVTATTAELNALDGVTAAGTALIQGADAAAQRTSLGLGTAALVNTGVAANNVPQINAGGFLPAGIAINWSTPQTVTTATAIDFTGVPSTATMIFVVARSATLSAADHFLVQLGAAGGFATTGYASSSVVMIAGSNGSVSSTAGFVVTSGAATRTWSGNMILTRMAGTATWVASHSGAGGTALSLAGGGDSNIGATVTQLRITRVSTATIAGTFMVGWL